jgi:hypothetical protein
LSFQLAGNLSFLLELLNPKLKDSGQARMTAMDKRKQVLFGG